MKPKEIGLLMTPENRRKSIAGIKTQTRRVIEGVDPECDRLVRCSTKSGDRS